MWVLSMLARSPKNGAEIMAAIEEMTQGWWRPSPGSIYPLLNELQAAGLIQKREDGRYELTKASRDEMGWSPWMPRGRPAGVDEMLADIDGTVSYFEDLARSDPSKVRPHVATLKGIADRISKLVNGGKA